MNKRGQAALEFIFIILLVIVYIFTVTKPMMDSSQGVIDDIQTITIADNETQKLYNSVKRISMLGENSKETILLFIPDNAKVGCYNDGVIGFSAKINKTEINGESINPEVALCKNNICDKNYPSLNGITVSCAFNTLTIGTQKFVVKKTGVSTVSIISG